jgi:threonine dehydrogenase-like Zn-dependent dehydrogenase
MRALMFHGAKDLRVEELPDPVPGPDEVLIQVRSAGICGSDVHGYSGETGRRVPGMVMGHEAAGVVAAAGAQVRGLRSGDAVTFNPVLDCGTCEMCRAGRHSLCSTRRVIGVTPDAVGAFAEWICVREANVLRLPHQLDTVHGALVEPMAVGVHAVALAGVRQGDRVLVFGAGAIGLTCAVAARLAGAGEIMAVDLIPERRALAERLGFPASEGVDAEALHQGGRPLGVDVVVDAVGVSATLRDGLGALRAGGTLLVVGLGQPQVSIGLYDVVVPEKRVLGSFAYDRDDFERAIDVVADTSSGLSAIVDHIVPLEAAPATFLDLAEGRETAAKVLVAPASD